MADSLAERLLDLAWRLDRLRPSSADPESYFVERDSIRAAIAAEARKLDARAEPRGPRGRFAAGRLVVGGRVIRAELRRPRRISRAATAPDRP